MEGFFRWLRINQDLGVLLLRLFIGFRLIYGVLDNILHWPQMLEFRDFLHQFGFPVPLASAVISVYGQFIAAILVILGLKIRYAALVLIVNFTIAWLMVDRHGSIETMTPALAILFCAILFLFQGGGKFSLDKEK